MLDQSSKAALRDYFKKLAPRETMDRKSKSDAICRSLLDSPLLKSATQIGLFYPRPFEVDLLTIWRRTPGRCSFPAVDRERALLFYTIDSLDQLVPGYGNIPEPDPSRGRLVQSWNRGDWLLVPGIAFDRWGGRLGTGKGYYDRFLSRLKEGVIKCGVAFESQISASPLPQEAIDVKMDFLCCEAGLLEVKG